MNRLWAPTTRVGLLGWLYLVSIACAPIEAMGGLASGVAAAEQESRPNILLAIADDWSWPHAGVYGDRVVKTPVFDKLAAEGVLFTRSFCVSPSCTPSRGAILTGQ